MKRHARNPTLRTIAAWLGIWLVVINALLGVPPGSAQAQASPLGTLVQICTPEGYRLVAQDGAPAQHDEDCQTGACCVPFSGAGAIPLVPDAEFALATPSADRQNPPTLPTDRRNGRIAHLSPGARAPPISI